MDKLLSNLWEWNQPQLLSLVVTLLICLILSLTTYIMIKKYSQPDKAPKGFVLIMEGYVQAIDSMYNESTGGKMPSARIYILGLATFLLIGNLLGLIGLEPVVTSYSVPFTLALISWLGIYVVGLLYQRFRFFKRYLNPIESIGQFAPLISLSFRIFGNIIGGSTILFLIYYFFGWIWTLLPGQANNAWYLFAVPITPILHMYFDMFGAVIQALVFTTLTTIYWSRETEEETKKSKKILKTQTNTY
ncbi:F0F1 ATP synthase subunit A [Mycoplasmopsis lipofaciens]|uniref:F0F1 ATP synthase subunit A n=1 Tax=Mycoplasmopsis lipofaciens TaxID=114884 RepID=UPI000480234A|nr:F0F1 ATP synthase subunit A [Mycoplasmopsis lipofaciens]